MRRNGHAKAHWLPRLALLLAFALLTGACASIESGASEPSGGDDDDADAGEPQRGGKMIFGLEAETTDGWCMPEAQLAIAGIQAARSVYDTLTVPDGDGNFEPFLAESVESNDDATAWTIEIREDITFHDGSELDAEVVANNIKAWTGQYPTRSPLLFTFVYQDVDTVEVVDDMTLKITTKRPWAAFPALLFSSGRAGIIAQAQLDDEEKCASNLIGTGPFELQEWRVNQHMKLVRNDDYWREDESGVQLPYLDELEFRPMEDGQQRVNSLKSGEIDAFHTDVAGGAQFFAEMRALDEAEQVNLIESGDFAEVGNVMLNATKPPFDNRTARKAAALALRSDLAAEILYRNIPDAANGPFPPGSMGYLEDTGYRTNDPDEARKLVQQYEEETGQPFEVEISGAGTPALLQLMSLVKQFWEAAGMKVRINTFEQSSLIQTAIERNYQAITWRNYPGLDPDTLYNWWYGEGNPVNFMGFDDPEVNELLDSGRTTTDPDERRQIYEDLNRELGKENYMLWSNWDIWGVPMDPEYHGVVGARPLEGSDYTGLALGFDPAYVWKEQ